MSTNIGVPFLNLQAQYPLIRTEVAAKLDEIISDAAFILGKHVEELEREFSRAHRVKFCLGVSSGTDALHIALQALQIGSGDEVIVPVNTFIATAEAVSLVGARPVFVDCDDSYNLDPDKTEALLAADRKYRRCKIKAVIPVHLYGTPANMGRIATLAAEYGVQVIEDAAQAHLAEWRGTKVGNFGSLAAFSFYPGKNLGAFGEAGALVTNDEALFARAKLFRQHGEITRYHHATLGHNYRMEAIQGAVLSTKLKHLQSWTQMRREVAASYHDLLADVEGLVLPQDDPDAYSVFHLYVIQAENRDALRTHLAERGIATALHYPVPLHLQPAFADLGYRPGDFPVAERAATRIVSLPMFPELTKEQITHVCDSIRSFQSSRYGRLRAAQDRPRRHVG